MVWALFTKSKKIYIVRNEVNTMEMYEMFHAVFLLVLQIYSY